MYLRLRASCLLPDIYCPQNVSPEVTPSANVAEEGLFPEQQQMPSLEPQQFGASQASPSAPGAGEMNAAYKVRPTVLELEGVANHNVAIFCHGTLGQ